MIWTMYKRKGLKMIVFHNNRYLTKIQKTSAKISIVVECWVNF